MRGRRRLALLALAVASTFAGCASPGSSRRPGAREQTDGRLRSKGPTIGHDFDAMPPGRVIPPTGLGVDLVESRAPVGPLAVATISPTAGRSTNSA